MDRSCYYPHLLQSQRETFLYLLSLVFLDIIFTAAIIQFIFLFYSFTLSLMIFSSTIWPLLHEAPIPEFFSFSLMMAAGCLL